MNILLHSDQYKLGVYKHLGKVLIPAGILPDFQ